MKFFVLLSIIFVSACTNQQAVNPGTNTNTNTVALEEGKTIFYGRCASCHMVNKEMTGPALRGVEDRWPDKKKLYAFIRNSGELIKTDPYAKNLWLQYNQTEMNKHPDLSDSQIEHILQYIKSVSVQP